MKTVLAERFSKVDYDQSIEIREQLWIRPDALVLMTAFCSVLHHGEVQELLLFPGGSC